MTNPPIVTMKRWTTSLLLVSYYRCNCIIRLLLIIYYVCYYQLHVMYYPPAISSIIRCFLSRESPIPCLSMMSLIYPQSLTCLTISLHPPHNIITICKSMHSRIPSSTSPFSAAATAANKSFISSSGIQSIVIAPSTFTLQSNPAIHCSNCQLPYDVTLDIFLM